mgnify:CR=1
MKKIVFFVIIMISMVGCSDLDIKRDNKLYYRGEVKLTENQLKLSKNTANFSFGVLAQMAKENKDNDICFSPLSLQYALSMLANGAAGTTRQEILDAMGFKKSTIDEVNVYNSLLMNKLSTIDEKVTVLSANSLWCDIGIEPKESFSKMIEGIYDGKSANIRYATDIDTVRQWITDKTNGMIKDFPQSLGERATIVNTVYFNGEWDNKFYIESTKQGCFYEADGKKEKGDVFYMHKYRFGTSYSSNNQYEMASFPFGSGAYVMYVILPQPKVTTSECIEMISKRGWDASRSNMAYSVLNVKLPRFTFEDQWHLGAALSNMGMSKAFNPFDSSGDFTNMVDNFYGKMDILQKCKIAVSEEGVEAGAATMTMYSTFNNKQVEIVDFYVTRPFIYVIQELNTGAILFVGQVHQPEMAQ